MDVRIKDFKVGMQLGTRGIELAVDHPNGGGHLGDLIITKTQVIWCEGRTGRARGKRVSLTTLRDWINEEGTGPARRRRAR